MRFVLCLAAASMAFAADHPNLNGVWKTADVTISIHQKDDAVDIAESGKENVEIQCNTTGQACKIKGGEVSLWYNGDSLVVMETLKSKARVIKKRLKVSEDGHSLEEEIVHIVPAAANEKVSLARQTGS
jgi:hypothetical protein